MTGKYQVSCAPCGLAQICVPSGLTADETAALDAIIKRGDSLQKGEALYRAGDPFASLYAVRSGCFKVYADGGDGTEQVIGFRLPGELLGLDAIDRQLHQSSAAALETAAVCEIPFKELERLSSSFPSLQSRLYRLLSREIRIDHQLQLLLAKRTAEERLGTFIANLAARHYRRRLSGTHFRLAMSRTDIANYLGLAVETISRVLTRLQDQGHLRVSGKDLQILNPPAICTMAHPHTVHHPPKLLATR